MTKHTRLHSEAVYDMLTALWEHPRRVDPGETVYFEINRAQEPFEVTQVRCFTDYHYLQLYYRGSTGAMTPFKFWMERQNVVVEDVVLLREFYSEMRDNPDKDYTVADLPDCTKIYFITE